MNGKKKIAAWTSSIAIILGVSAFLGIKGDFFQSRIEGAVSAEQFKAFKAEFEEYKLSHDKWESVNIKRFEEKIDAMAIQVSELRQDNRRLEDKIDHLAGRLPVRE